eukprot:2955126-Pyramimonas_sp.AAC.2
MPLLSPADVEPPLGLDTDIRRPVRVEPQLLTPERSALFAFASSFAGELPQHPRARRYDRADDSG